VQETNRTSWTLLAMVAIHFSDSLDRAKNTSSDGQLAV
jgi:hypothetical protein